MVGTALKCHHEEFIFQCLGNINCILHHESFGQQSITIREDHRKGLIDPFWDWVMYPFNWEFVKILLFWENSLTNKAQCNLAKKTKILYSFFDFHLHITRLIIKLML